MAATPGNRPRQSGALYTAEQRQRRDASFWTPVQGILAAAQFVAFGISLVLVLRYLIAGTGVEAAAVSVVIKTAFLYAIMVTGSLWERDVFGRFLFAPAFFWEDIVSMAVIALHTAYLLLWLLGVGSPAEQFLVALAGYAAYVVNAGQFLWKFRLARREAPVALGGAA